MCAAAQKMAQRPRMQSLSVVGRSGPYTNNARRDFCRTLNLGIINIAEPTPIDFPMWSESAVARDRPGRVQQQYPLLPHEFLASMYPHYQAELETYILGLQPLRDCWGRFDAENPASEHNLSSGSLTTPIGHPAPDPWRRRASRQGQAPQSRRGLDELDGRGAGDNLGHTSSRCLESSTGRRPTTTQRAPAR